MNQILTTLAIDDDGNEATTLHLALPSHTNIVLRFSDGQVSIARMVNTDHHFI
jgi:hypothetical protein